ncbi:hypothetical protein ACP70R_048065 [Stipagrostis hirtigluma subsp. patula]
MADQPAECSRLPAHLLELIADKTRDAVSGVTLFRSVCPAWRAAAAEAPRLLLPVPRNSATTPPRAGSEHALVFPLARGWSIVVDVRDTSCRLSHLATGATAALPDLNAGSEDPCEVRRAGELRRLRAGTGRDLLAQGDWRRRHWLRPVPGRPPRHLRRWRRRRRRKPDLLCARRDNVQ